MNAAIMEAEYTPARVHIVKDDTQVRKPVKRCVGRFTTIILPVGGSPQLLLGRAEGRRQAYLSIWVNPINGTQANAYGWVGTSEANVQQASLAGSNAGCYFISAVVHPNSNPVFGSNEIWVAIDPAATASLIVAASYELESE